MPSVAGELAPGHSFGARYRIIKLLGRGGMGAVYQAWDEELGVVVAIKLILTDIAKDPQSAAEVERRFKRELVLARQVTHKNVVRIHDLGEIDGVKYITMQFVHGPNLASVLRRRGRLPVVEALRIARQIALGLVAAHEVGIVHRDLKPANIMLDDEDHAYIVDFGIARSAVSGSTAGAVTGTVEYMSPEQVRGLPPDQRIDIYAFGLILLDMVSGSQRLAAAPSVMAELMERMQQAPPPARSVDPSVPEAVDQIVARCVRPDPAERYATSSELLADLERLDEVGRLTAPLTAGQVTVARAPKRAVFAGRWRPLAVLALALLVLGVAVTAFVARGAWLSRGLRPGAGDKPTTLAVLPFRNATGDASLDWLGESLAEMLADDMSQVTAFQVVPNERIFRLLSDLRISASAVDVATIGRVGDLSSASLVVSGKYLKVGGQTLRIEATVYDISQGRESPLTARAPDPNAVADAAQQLAGGLMRRSVSAERLAIGPLAPSSRSPQAIREYNIGLQFARDARYEGALKHFEAATTADPKFALAYSKAAEMHSNLGRDADAQKLSQTAADLAADLPERERHLIEARHARLSRDNAKAIEAYKRAAALSVRDTTVRFELASLYEATGSLDNARSELESVLAADPKNLDALVAFGRVEIKRKNPQGALDPLNRALTLAVQFENEEARGSILNAMGIAYKRLNRPDDALQYYEQSIAIKRRTGQRAGIAATVSEIAQIQQRLGKPEEALKSYQEALSIRRDLGDKRGTANSLIDLGQLYDDRGQYDEGLKTYREALQIERELGDQNYEALCLNNMGSAYLSKGLQTEALTYFERALEIREKLKATSDIAQTLHNIGEVSLRQGQYDKALRTYVRALDLRRTVGDKRATAFESYSIGTILDYQGRYGAALKANEEALTVFRGLHDRSIWLAEVLSSYGDTLNQLGRAEEGRRPLDEALALAHELGNGALISRALNAQGWSHVYRGDWRSAGMAFSDALREATRAGGQREMLESELNVAKTQLAEGQRQNAAARLTAVANKAEQAGLGYVSLDASISLAEARVAEGQYARAGADLQTALRLSERAGLLALLARTHYLYAGVLRASGQPKEAGREYGQALRVLNDIAKETGNAELVFKRADFGTMRREAEKWAVSPS